METKGTEADRRLADWYLSKIDGNLHGTASSLARTDTSSGYLQLDLEASLQGNMSPPLTFSTEMGGLAASSLNSALLLPDYQRSLLDFINDNAVSSIMDLYPRMRLIGSGTFRTDTTYFQAGKIRGSFGPFWGDNAVLSPTSPQTGQFSFVYHNNKIAFTMALLNMTATDPSGGSITPYKFLSLGSLEYYPSSWVSLGVFDSVTWGETFNPLYLLSTVLYYVEGTEGFPDKAYIGLSGEVSFPDAIKSDFLLYVSDADFNDLIRLDFNTIITATFQVGVRWTPNWPLLARLSLTNMLITPYMYTH